MKIHVKGEYCAGPRCDCGYKPMHTPGPWSLFNRSAIASHQLFRIEYSKDGNRSVIADIEPSWLCEEHGNAEANARLIAAAPELLEACKEALRLADSNSPGKVIDICDILRDAVSKAEGKGAT